MSAHMALQLEKMQTEKTALVLCIAQLEADLKVTRARSALLDMTMVTMRSHLEATRAAEKRSVQDVLRGLAYDTETTDAIHVGECDEYGRPASQRTFTPFDIPGRTYSTGCAKIPMTVFLEAKVCNLSEYLRGVFQAKGRSIFEQVNNFLKDKWEDLATYDLYTLAINLDLRDQGKKKVDLPNVNFAVTMLFLHKLPDHDFVVSDPIYKGTDASVRITNYSHALRKLREMATRVQTFKNPCASSYNGLDIVLYQRGTGDPDPKAMRAIRAATGLGPGHIMHMHLVPGKESVGYSGGNCYKDYTQSAAAIFHELSMLDSFARAKGKTYMNDVKLVLDPFSGYAAFTAVAILGYGIEDMYHVLAGRYVDGVLTYTPMTTPRD